MIENWLSIDSVGMLSNCSGSGIASSQTLFLTEDSYCLRSASLCYLNISCNDLGIMHSYIAVLDRFAESLNHRRLPYFLFTFSYCTVVSKAIVDVA
ncbi:uncharacterized protein METZ01_LOCUS434595 [marine metagenome]|uniref:Uncharacterized protein n=1 Tax=marine metagenome TaxID=408172 RepID=A0A382YFQ7_9ZZZZ